MAQHCRNQQKFRSEMSKVWQDWTHAEGLQHEYGSCEVLQVRTERAYWLGRVQPRTPSPKRAVEEMARNDAAARGSAPAKAEAAKAAPAETIL